MSPGFDEYGGGILALLNRTTPLSFSSQTRALMHAAQSIRLRPKTAAAAFGGVVSLAVGGAYLGGVAAQASTVRAQAERLQGAGAEGYTQEAMAAAAGGLDASALAIADRHDPYSVAGAAQRDRQAELRAVVQRYAARLEQHVRTDPYNWFNWHDFWNLDDRRDESAVRGRALADAVARSAA